MKNTVMSLAALAALGVIAYLGTRLHAQNQVQQTAATAQSKPLQTRIAVVNLPQVIKKYRKWNEFETSYKTLYGQYNAEFEKRKTAGLDFKSQLDKATDDPTRERISAQIKELDRQVQDLGEAAKKQLGKMRDDQAQLVYQEIEQAVQAYARANDIEMVLHYSDAVNPQDYYHPMNIQRKLQMGACMPMFLARGMDITDTIAVMLNQRLGATSAPASAPGTKQR